MRLASRTLPVLIILLVILQFLFPYRGWITLLIALGGLFVICFFWARGLARGLSFRRERRFGLAQVGDSLEERFTIINESWFPAQWFEVIDGSTLPGYRVSRATGIGPRDQLQWTTQGVCERRGAFMLGPTTLRTGDPFGIFTVEICNPTATQIFVLPPIVPLPAIDVAAGGRAGEGRPKRNAPERTVAASTVRGYVSGDDLRWIHWPTSARRDSLHVRLFENTPSGDWWIFLDLEARVQTHNTDEHAIILAASLIDRGLRDGHAVGLVTHGDSLVRLPPTVGSGAKLDMLRALALVTPGSVSLADLLTRARPPLRELASIIVITPNVEGDWIESLLPLLWRGAVPTVLALDPASFGGESSADGIQSTLADLRITNYRITRDLLDRPEAHPGKQGQWQWRISATGHASLADKPGDLEWKAL